MYPNTHHPKTGPRLLAGLLAAGAALWLLVLDPALGRAAARRAGALLGSAALFRTVVFLETGVLPEPPTRALEGQAPDQAPQSSEAPATQAHSAPESSAADPSTQVPSTAAPTEAATEPAAVQASAEPPAPFTAREAEGIKLRGSCSYAFDKEALLLRPLDWKRAPGPKVLILHSHTSESYTQSEGHTYLPSANFRTLDPENNVVAVGAALARELEALGVETVHDRSFNDYPDYNSSYGNARKVIQRWLAEEPSIVMVIDVHRDALEKPVRETVERNGQTLAPLMLLIGTDQGGLSHPHWADNLSCGLKLQALALRDQPSLFKALSFRKERFNGDLCPGAFIVEVGSTENTLPEALASMPYLARYVAQLLQSAGIIP